MPIDPFPERVTPRKLCQRNGTINSTIALGKLLRLSEYLHDNHGQAEVSLRFDRDDAGHCVINGTVRAAVSMQCQRCLEGTTVEVQSTLALVVADDERQEQAIAEATAETPEIVVCEDGELDLLSVVEDELIMSLPIVARHDNDRCSEPLNSLYEKEQETGQTGQGNIKGLEALATLKQALHKDSDTGKKARQDQKEQKEQKEQKDRKDRNKE